MTREDAIEAARRGAYAAFVSAAISTIAMTIAISLDAKDGVLGYLNDPLIVLDVILAVACGFGMLRKSRVAAVTMLLEFVTAQVSFVLETGRPPGLVVGLVFLYFFGRAVQGTFRFHKIEREENPEYKGPARWTYWVGGSALGLLAILLVFFAFSEIGIIPSAKVLSGAELPRRQQEQLVASEIISNDEVVEFFYSEAMFSVVAAGNVLTNRRVISYWTDENGDLQIASLPISEIESVELVDTGGVLSDSVYLVSGFDDDKWLQVVLSTQEAGNEKFVEALRGKLQRQDDSPPGGL